MHTDTAPGGFAAAARLALYGVENKATKLETAFQKSVFICVHLWPSPGSKPCSNERGHVSALIGVYPRTHVWRPWREHSSRRKLMKCVEDSCCETPAWLPGLYVR
jgi:hypothetical protein